jgi:hypothetical protein
MSDMAMWSRDFHCASPWNALSIQARFSGACFRVGLLPVARGGNRSGDQLSFAWESPRRFMQAVQQGLFHAVFMLECFKQSSHPGGALF